MMDPELLNLPLGVKIRVVPGSEPVFCRAKLGEKLHRPWGYFHLGDPYCRLMRTEYNSLHDPYLRKYHNRKDNLQRLKRQGLVTSDGQVVCTLKEFNEYRQYLTTLKLEVEKTFRQEQERLQQQVAKWKDATKPPGTINNSCLTKRLLRPRRPTCPPPPKSGKISVQSGRCRRVKAALDGGQTYSQPELGQERDELPMSTSSDADSETALANTVAVRTMACWIADVLEWVRQPGPALAPELDFGRRVTKPRRPQHRKESCCAEDTLPSRGTQFSRQPVPPAGPKPPAQTGARRCHAEDTLPSRGTHFSRQPFPPAGPKPPAQTGARRCHAEDTLPSMTTQFSRQPVPPAGPKPPAQTGARRRSVRVKPV